MSTARRRLQKGRAIEMIDTQFFQVRNNLRRIVETELTIQLDAVSGLRFTQHGASRREIAIQYLPLCRQLAASRPPRARPRSWYPAPVSSSAPIFQAVAQTPPAPNEH